MQPDRFDSRLAQRVGGADTVLSSEEVSRFIRERLSEEPVDRQSVCLVVPDGTRSCPMPLLISAAHGALAGRVSRLTVLIALGTHAPMSEQALALHLGYAEQGLEATYPGMTVVNHEWWKEETFARLGTIPAERLRDLSKGLLDEDVDVLLNRAVVDHDVSIVIGPVLPHEVVGMSGGNKYFFPGVCGQRIIDVSHWLGALITSAEIIGTTELTPVRALVNEGAALIPRRTLAFSVVTANDDGIHSVSFGDPISSWADAAGISAETHITHVERPYQRVISLVPTMYDEVWTAAKGFYKVEPVVADGGEVIIFAPHVTQFASSHPQLLDIGYHCRDYYVKQWDRFKDVHWGVLAHSTHLRGSGTYDPTTDTEQLRVNVTLATGISEADCLAMNLGYVDAASLDIEAFRADPEALVVDRAGEVLFRLR